MEESVQKTKRILPDISICLFISSSVENEDRRERDKKVNLLLKAKPKSLQRQQDEEKRETSYNQEKDPINYHGLIIRSISKHSFVNCCMASMLRLSWLMSLPLLTFLNLVILIVFGIQCAAQILPQWQLLAYFVQTQSSIHLT